MKRYRPPTRKLPFESDKGYHVFLSFRGKDVRKTLVDHLFEALSAAGLNVFLDEDKLEKGQRIWGSLEKAIERSAIHIPIFSEGYANSAWCLKEATSMLRTSGLIIPLFYRVNPTHVRYPLDDHSPYKPSFLKHYGRPERYRSGDIDRWREALEQICECSGWSTDVTGGYEARLVKMVVKDLILTLDRVPLHVAKHPVGIDNVKTAIIQKFSYNSGEEVVKVGIWGIGGIGKTTVAKAVYNQVYAHFKAASFVFDVRGTAAKATGLQKLQTKVLKDLCNYNGKVDGVAQGISLFNDRLGGNSVLLILDDVDDVVQLEALLGDWLAPGSRVIITSRNKHILNFAGIPPECIHEMNGLEITEALHLFSWHAFLRPSPSPKYQDLSTEIVEACKGHPLSLKVIGCSLFDKQGEESCWREALHNIKHNQDIYKELKISYNTLSEEEKEIFVDIACFFIGENKTLPIIFWKSLYTMVEGSLHNLLLKALVEIEAGDVFHMHDRLQDMGRTIADKKEKRTRQWKVAHLSTISNNINLSRLQLTEGNSQTLEGLKSSVLRYLHLQSICIEDMTEDTLDMLPRSLIWLRLEHCTFGIGTNRAADKPRHSRYMDNIWELKVMQLKDCPDLDSVFLTSMFSLPNDLSQLQHLDLRCCKSLISLPDSIGNLSQLQYLDLGWCDRLNNLPGTIGNLSQLQHMNLERCVSLHNLPGTIADLSKLEHLNLESCLNLNNLPSSIGNLLQLQNLNLRWCDRLSNLPNEIGNLSELKNLYLGKCRNLDNLPDSIGNLSQLQQLDLEGCIKLTDLPSTIGNMSGLQQLNLKWCESLKNLPDTVVTLPQLRHLELRGCKSLRILPPRILSRPQLHF